ncbi:MAG: UDP-N-acetylmuramoyl-L-alanyl-D-glutamate--2,6-diaminopimelate ligase [Bacillota bacterium]|jgi:UDP-N-acetylmuramoyl-L-alanyl-D-glutamate--2,6-diaminopimelate ligase|nr:UDP-N-acetylmuramoyl-L-alanyl-D-glutamate--2,6-diaminopimelate ligase [Bacillota bacterium]NLP22710.1 UDP-N-acetylmuramoyl-L-alanyl-D-glutamate--2,6-diaminopimelate ligase [Erysipelotrichaceae bacterium]
MVKLSYLFQNAPDIEIKSLMSDSRKKRPDSIFFCVKGMMFNGHRFINQAIENGAKVIVHSESLEDINPDITYIKVKNVQQAFNSVADAFYGRASSKLRMFGITGTNGKSSVASLIKDLLDEYEPTGYIGTIAIEYGSVKLEPTLTTPEVDDLHGILRDMVNANIKACALEVSSIGIEQERVSSIDFDVAIFTNLTHDHLDYHGNMENYYEIKKRFFDSIKPTGTVITNVDDTYGLSIVEDVSCKVLTYGIHNEADYQAINFQIMKDKTVFTLVCFGRRYKVETNLVAMFNIYNLLACLAALDSQGFNIEKMIPKLTNIKQIEGRMQRIDLGQPFNIIVDFAHTPDGIKKVCEYASKITPKGNRIISVFGSAGKRDTKKRKIFGEIADKYCDMIILTEDDPRDESVYDIAMEIASGIKETNYVIIEDRYYAIQQAIELALANDTILILGKGNETFIYREFGTEQYLGDDKVVKETINKIMEERNEIEQVY